MKKILFIVMILGLAIFSQAQTIATKGLEVGTKAVPVTLTTLELKTLKGVTTSSTLATQLDAKANKADTTSFSSIVYTKSEVDGFNAILYQDQFQNDAFDISGINYLFPIASYSIFGTGGVALASGTAQYVTYRVKTTTTVSKVTFMQTSPTGAYTSDAYNGFALYAVNKSTGALTELTRTVNDGNMWKQTAFTKVTVNFGASQSLTAGYYAVGLLYHSSAQTTVPQLYSAGTINGFSSLFLGGFRIAAAQTGQTDLPTSTNFSTLSGGATVWNVLIHN